LNKISEQEKMIPNWMKEVDIGPCQCAAVYHGKKSFIGKTIEGIFDFLQEAFVTETYTKRDGLLQSLDPRAKLVSILAVIFATSLIADLNVLIFGTCSIARKIILRLGSYLPTWA
jgi:cobalt/nickel transport system permease protein